MLIKKNYLIKILIIATLIILWSPGIANAEPTSKIGDKCVNGGWFPNSDCNHGGANLDCSASNLVENGTAVSYCTCKNASQCQDLNGGNQPADGGDWKCDTAGSFTYDLEYCHSSNMTLGDYLPQGMAVDPMAHPQYYCLVSDKTTAETSCVTVPAKSSCSALPNKFYLDKISTNFTVLSPSPALQPDCLKAKTAIDSGKYCNLKEVCVSDKSNDCSAKGTILFDTFAACQASITTQACKLQGDCPSSFSCINGGCINQANLIDSSVACGQDSDCKAGGNQGVCLLFYQDASHHTQNCYYKNAPTTAVETTPCGSAVCTKSEKSCPAGAADCATGLGVGICKDTFCWFDPAAMTQYKSAPSILGITAELKIQKPVLGITIGGWSWNSFSNLASTTATEENGITYLHIPYIGEYLSVIYKFCMVAVSIVGVIMIVVVGIKITVLGGEERVNGFKRIGQIAIGLFIAWGSYTILYTVNPDLVTFQALKVQYMPAQQLPDFGPETITAGEDLEADAGGKYPFFYFKDGCPVDLNDNPPVYNPDVSEKKAKDNNLAIKFVMQNTPRRLEFHQKMMDQNILDKDPKPSTISQRILKAIEATAQCKIQYENCGVGTTNIQALASIGQGGSDATALQCLNYTLKQKGNACNRLGLSIGSIKRAPVAGRNALGSVSTRGMFCGSIEACCSGPTKKPPTPPATETDAQKTAREANNAKIESCMTQKKATCIPTQDAAFAALTAKLTSGSSGWSPSWVDDLQAGDYYYLINFNPSCEGAHSAMFVAWKNKAAREAWVESGDGGHFVRINVMKFDPKELLLQISRPIQ